MENMEMVDIIFNKLLSVHSYAEFEMEIEKYNMEYLETIVGKVKSSIKTDNIENDYIIFFLLNLYRYFISWGFRYDLDYGVIEDIRNLLLKLSVPDNFIKKYKWAAVFMRIEWKEDRIKQFVKRIVSYSPVENIKTFRDVIDTWLVYHLLINIFVIERFKKLKYIDKLSEEILLDYIYLINSNSELEHIFGVAIEHDVEKLKKMQNKIYGLNLKIVVKKILRFFKKRIKDIDSKIDSYLTVVFNGEIVKLLEHKINDKVDSKRITKKISNIVTTREISIIDEKIKDVLFRRYAIDKIINFYSVLGGLVILIITVSMFQNSWNIGINKLWYIGSILFLTFLWLFEWKFFGEKIPKFVWLGAVGWSLVFSSVMADSLESGTWTYNNTKEGYVHEVMSSNLPKIVSIQYHNWGIPASRLMGCNEQEVLYLNINSIMDRMLFYVSPHLVSYNNNIVVKIMNFILLVISSVLLFVLFVISSTNSDNDKLFGKDNEDVNNKKKINMKMVYKVILFGLMVILSIVFFIVGCINVGMKLNSSVNWLSFVNSLLLLVGIIVLLVWYNKKVFIVIMMIIVSASFTYFYAITKNYFILFTISSIVGSIFVVRWEIKSRGQNHKLLQRSLFLTLLSYNITLITGALISIFLYPMLVYMKKGILEIVPTDYDKVIIFWILISGAALSVLLGLITQIIWSGSRLTERM